MTYPKPFDRITVEEGKMAGQPCIRGMRITVKNVLVIIASYPDRQSLFTEFPNLEEEDLKQALNFAAAAMGNSIAPLRLAS